MFFLQTTANIIDIPLVFVSKNNKIVIADIHSYFLYFAGDSLDYHNGRAFTTKDRDNDARSSSNCAVQRHGAWWYGSCYFSNLNGRYFNEAGRLDYNGISWRHWKNSYYSMKRVSMKIRPNN